MTDQNIEQQHTPEHAGDKNCKCHSKKCNTQQRLLDAASELFGRHSYKRVTVAEICKLADANIAAVNYHFGGKENLYTQAWKYAWTRGIKKYPADGGVAPDAEPTEKLAARLRALMYRASDRDNAEFNIVHNEIHNPTGLLQEVMDDVLEPLRRDMQQIIREIIGPGADEITVKLCHTCVLSQAMHLILRRQMKHQGLKREPLEGIELERIIDHIIEFSLAGVLRFRDKAMQNTANNTSIDKQGD